MDKTTNSEKDRSIYINNIPEGNINNTFGTGYTNLKGLLPGLIENVNNIDPLSSLKAYISGSESSECQQINLEVIAPNGESSYNNAYMTTTDIRNLNPCWFNDNTNLITNAECPTRSQSGFENYNENPEIRKTYGMNQGMQLKQH